MTIEVDADQAAAAGDCLQAAMLDGTTQLLDPIPVLIEITAGQTWAQRV